MRILTREVNPGDLAKVKILDYYWLLCLALLTIITEKSYITFAELTNLELLTLGQRKHGSLTLEEPRPYGQEVFDHDNIDLAKMWS